MSRAKTNLPSRAGISTVLILASTMLAGTAAMAEDVRTIEIRATEFSFEPEQIEVRKGETVKIKLVNRGSLSHNLHLKGVPVKTETVQSGASDTIKFTAKQDGSIRFFCNVPGHKQAGMKGHIAIE